MPSSTTSTTSAICGPPAAAGVAAGAGSGHACRDVGTRCRHLLHRAACAVRRVSQMCNVRQCKQRLAVIASASQLEATCCLCSVLVSQVLPWQPPSSARCLNALRYCRFAAKAAEKGGLLFAESLLKKIDREVGAFRAKLSESAAGADTITSMSWLPHRISGLANMPIVSFAQHAKFLLSSRHASQHAQSMILIVIRRFVCSGMVRSAVRANRMLTSGLGYVCLQRMQRRPHQPKVSQPSSQPRTPMQLQRPSRRSRARRPRWRRRRRRRLPGAGCSGAPRRRPLCCKTWGGANQHSNTSNATPAAA